MPDASIPGFTAEQKWVIEQVADAAAERAIAKLRENGCPVSGCSERGELQAVVFGRAEAGIVGLDERVATLERTNATLRRVTWMAVSGVVLGVIGLVFALVQLAITGS